jgi:5-methylcytosine-specific restriction endonuclease McrA
VEQLLKRRKRLERVVSVLSAKLNDPVFQEAEEAKKQQLQQRREKVERAIDSLYRDASERIDAIYRFESKCYQRAQGFWDRLFGLTKDFKYKLSRYGACSKRFRESGNSDSISGTDYGPYRQTEDVWSRVREIEIDFDNSVGHLREELAKYERELRPFQDGGFTISQLEVVKRKLDQTLEELGEARHTEQRLRKVFNVDDITIAQAKAYVQETRSLADQIKPQLLSQLDITSDCPYCGDGIGSTPHADHIFPVTLGGLSVPENMVLCCSNCNLRKQDLTLREFIEKFGMERSLIEDRLQRLGKRF